LENLVVDAQKKSQASEAEENPQQLELKNKPRKVEELEPRRFFWSEN